MTPFDMKTVVTGYMLSNFICMVVMASLWSSNRRRYAGFGLWMADYFLQFIGLTGLSFRGVLPEAVTQLIGNPLLIGGTVLLLAGLELFIGKHGTHLPHILFYAAYLILHAVFLFFTPDREARSILFSAALAVLCLEGSRLMFFKVDQRLKAVTAGVGAVMFIFGVVTIIRLGFIVAAPAVGDGFFRSPGYETIVLFIYQMLFIVLTFALSLMVNARLIREKENEAVLRARAHHILKIRLRLWEYAGAHTVNELMQQALDEIEDLTGSLIGFYHFVDSDENQLSLRAWSTRTREVFCRAEGEGRHYPLSEAGVWADAVRERRPVIHNDYASLPRRRGLPPGHAPVIRELVVPTLRDGCVVSVLGVGNKPAPYDEEDVMIVSYIADLIWTIIEQKRFHEEIKRLNERLKQQANTDELTGLANRRAFFARGTEEVKRSRRHRHPLSLILLDIDHFKDVNDSYGHDVGDRVLCTVAETLTANIREIDLAARLGGEEFGVLLPNTQASDAVLLAERLRRAIAEVAVGSASEVRVSASFGVSMLVEDVPDINTLLKRADIAMYQAKREGRNRVCVVEASNEMHDGKEQPPRCGDEPHFMPGAS